MNKTMAGVTLAAIILASGAQAQDAQDGRQQGPIEIDKCQTISQPGSYRLVNNLTFKGPSGSACLSITASFVTIDLAGFTITSISQGGPFFIAAAIRADDNTTGITVRNGSISGTFTYGVLLDGDGSIVEGIQVSNLNCCSDEMGQGIGATGIVRNNTVIGVNGGTSLAGIGIFGIGLITGNYVAHTKTSGINAGQGSTVIGNTVTNANGGGIAVNCPSNVTDNTAIANGPIGPNLVLKGTGCSNTNNVAP